MSNVRATVVDKAIPLKFKTTNNIDHGYNLLLGIKSIALSLKAQVVPLGRRNRRNIESLRQISRDIIALTSKVRLIRPSTFYCFNNLGVTAAVAYR